MDVKHPSRPRFFHTLPSALVFAVLAVVFFPSSLFAVTLPIDLSVTGWANGEMVSQEISDVEGDVNADGFFGADGRVETALHTIDWTVTGNQDPVVTGAFAVTNLANTPQIFELSMTVAADPTIIGGSFTGGSMGGSLIDITGNGATLSTVPGRPLYTALIDGVEFATMGDAPFSVTINDAFGAAVVDPQRFGQPIPSMAGPDVLDSIAITLAFELSPGDAASITGVFVAEPVPEPGTWLLAALALLGLPWLRRILR